MTVGIFGSGYIASKKIYLLEIILTDLIINYNTHLFYLGNQNRFDAKAKELLENLKGIYPQIRYKIIVPKSSEHIKAADIYFPKSFAYLPRKKAEFKCKEWIVHHSDTVIILEHKKFKGLENLKNLTIENNKNIIIVAE